MKVKEKGKFASIKYKNFKVILCDIGASIYDVLYYKKHMVMAPFGKEKWANDITAYFGKTAGRICGRVKDCKLVLGNKTYEMNKNDGANSLHGGVDGISTRKFARTIKVNKDNVTVRFDYMSPDGEMGYPGNVLITITYVINANNSIEITFESNSDCDTPIDLTNHCYYNLGGEKDITNHFIRGNIEGCFYAREDTTVDISKLLKFKNVDLRKGCTFNQLVSEDCFQSFFQKGIDHCFKWGEGDKYIEVMSKKFRMKITSDYPAFQIYSENFPVKGKLLNNLRFDKKYQAIAIEPQEIPTDYQNMMSVKGKLKSRNMKIEFSKR